MESMKLQPLTAAIIDVIGSHDQSEEFLSMVQTKAHDDNLSLKYVYFLTGDKVLDIPENITKSLNVSCVSGRQRPGSFYSAKRDLDNNGVSSIYIYCLNHRKGYWTAICNLLLTPVHTWHVETLQSENTESFEFDLVEFEVKNMLKTLPSRGELTVLTTSLIPANLFNHGYSTRTGGITTIPSLDSLNLLYTIKKRDSSLAVAENLRRLAEVARFDRESFIITRTEHSNKVWVVSTERPEKFDSVVTDKVGLTLAAAGADCTPLLFADPVKRVCAAAHAGYRGTVKRVVVETINTMTNSFGCLPADILVTMGPTVCADCFPLDIKDPAVDDFLAIDPSTLDFRKVTGKVHPNLVKTNTLLLQRAGILPDHIDSTHAVCSACDSERFFSYQRDGFPFGNQIGFISIKPCYVL